MERGVDRKPVFVLSRPHGLQPLFMEFPRQAFWSGLPSSPSRELPDPSTESESSES